MAARVEIAARCARAYAKSSTKLIGYATNAAGRRKRVYG